ncbi:MAG: inorganic phosphate transporter [Clostridia bacterium]|nr:inorganic phosphate transporter [Clostridia bacterium]MDE7328369.1 inorganic phosphate transporter [Clostridia bacterium]
MSGYVIVIFILALVYTFYMGFSDGANAVATCVATRAIRPKYALIISGVVKFIAPIVICYLLGNDSVARTVGRLIKSSAFEGISAKEGFIFLLSTMIATLAWSAVSVITSVPNSTSHTLLGGLVGAGLASFGFSNVDWAMVGLRVILMVFLTPMMCMLVGYVISKIFTAICSKMDRSVKKAFKVLQVFNVTLLSTSISINNVQKSMGIYLLAMVVCSGESLQGFEFNFWSIAVMSAAIMLGLLFGGYKLIYTVGKKIYPLGTLQSVSAQVSTAAVALTCSFTGIPVSTGQVVSSSIIGVGMANRIRAVRWGRARRIFSSWVLTFPIAMAVGAIICLLLRAIFI